MDPKRYYAKTLFDGQRMREDICFSVLDGKIIDWDIGAAPGVISLGPGLVVPGYVDLQVNGGGGVMLNHNPIPDIIRKIQQAHLRRGTTFLLPTLITASFETTSQAVAAAIDAGCSGLHLEGPHLDLRRKGAHSARYIRQMDAQDLALYCAAAGKLRLKLTVAPSSVTKDQLRRLSDAGVIVSLGHSEADYEEAIAYFETGARCVTHLFNAMSSSFARAPGLVGAAIDHQSVYCGIIADGLHVHIANLRQAAQAKSERLYLVSDAMATVGSEEASFELDGREITRTGDRLTLSDGTLAGAHLDMAQAVRVMVQEAGIELTKALAMATSIPARAIGAFNVGRLAPGLQADFLLLDRALQVSRIWKGGSEIL